MRVAAQMAVEFEVRRRALGLDVDEELQGPPVTPVDRAVVGLDAGGERGEVEGFEGAGRVEVDRVVGDEELVADEVDVGLDAAEAVVEGVEQGPQVLVVVMGVGTPQGARVVLLLPASAREAGRATEPARAAPRVVRALRRVVRAMLCLP